MNKPLEKTDANDPKLVALTTLLMMQAEARKKKDIASLSFLMVNETHRLVPFRQCVFWRLKGSRVSVETVSGLSTLDKHAPYLAWLEKTIGGRTKEDTGITVYTAADMGGEDKADWEEWCGKYALFVPFYDGESNLIGGLWLDRQEAFGDGEKNLMAQLADAYSHALYAFDKKNTWTLGVKHYPLRIFSVGILAALMFLPVKLSVTVPAEVIALDPFVIAAPMDGVIKDVAVKPNQDVKKGDTLVLIDDTDLKNRVEISVKELAVAEASYEKTSREAFTDISKKAELEILKAEVEARRADLSYTRELLQKTEIKSQTDGVAIFSDPNDLRGIPVHTGQRIMLVSAPRDTELLARIPADALIDINENESVRLFLNVSPLDSISADIKTIGYEATPDPDGLITYKLKASFQDKEDAPAIGLKGTAKIYGGRTILGYKILRRPLMSLRQFLGL